MASSAIRGVDQTNAANVVDVLNPSVENVAPSEHAIVQGYRLCRQHDLGVRIVEPAVDANRAAIIDIAGELLARREQDQPTILLCQCVRHRIGRGGVVHVEQHRGCILANAVRLCPPVAGADAIADKIIGPPLVRAGGDNHGVGLDGQHVIRGCGLAKFDFHACALRLPLHPSEQRLVFFLAGQARLPSKLAAEPLRRAEQSYVMTALGCDARRLQAGRACSDDGDAAARRRACGTPRRFTSAAKLRIERFGERPADVNFAPGEIVEAGRPDVIRSCRRALWRASRRPRSAPASCRQDRRRPRQGPLRPPPALRCGRSP